MSSGLNVNGIHQKWNTNVINEDNGNISALKDMINIRDGFKHCNVLDIDLGEELIDGICV